jgi:hypothetical protein
MSAKQLLTTFVLALVISATAASAASARPIDAVGASVSDPAAYVSNEPTVSEPADSSSGFDWGDAGIGAGAAFAVTMIGLGGVLVLTSRRQRRPERTAAA